MQWIYFIPFGIWAYFSLLININIESLKGLYNQQRKIIWKWPVGDKIFVEHFALCSLKVPARQNKKIR